MRPGLVPARTLLYDGLQMTGGEFLKRLQRYARERQLAFRFEPGKGKGSHGMVFLGERFTVVKDRKKELGSGLLHAMLRSLGVIERDF